MKLPQLRFRLPMPSNEEGQSVVIVALFLFFIFMAFAALSIDGTIIYMHRRRLQNIADAATLAAAIELNQNSTEAQAYQAAMDSIASNEGLIEWYSTSNTPNPPATNVGSDQDLVVGIEITGQCDVRVALRWNDVGTYFAQFVGRGLLQVGARARAGCNRAGGLQPIAVKRFGDQFDWDLSPGLNTNNASIYCDSCDTQQAIQGPPPQGLGNGNDFLRPESSDIITEWPGWPDSTVLYESPTPHADLASGAPGREYFFLGGGVKPNVGATSYAGLINMDIRHISAPPVEYYNGIDAGTNSNTLKDLGEYYIRRGYCCDIPQPGDQVAVYNGNSTAFVAQAFQETYQVGDVVAVIVYNGTVFNTPNLAMVGNDPNYNNPATYPTTTTLASNAVTYTLDLEAELGFQSAPGGLTLGVEGLSGFADWSFSPTTSPVLGHSGITQRTIDFTAVPTVTTVGTTTQVITGTRMFYLSAIDDKMGGTDIRRYWAGIVSIGEDLGGGVYRQLPSVTGYPDPIILSIIKGDPATTIRLNLDAWGVTSNQSVTVTPGSLPTGFSWGNPGPPWTKTVQWDDHPGSGFNIKLNVADTAVSQPTPYAIPLTVSATGMTPQSFNLYVIVEDANTTVQDYVEILGYAALEVTGFYNSGNLIDPTDPTPPPANAVRGRIVSELWDDPSKMTYGMRARLIPWN